ncbi:hypothetical protein [Faecalimonas sp.]
MALNLKQYMKQVNVKRREYVKEWIENDLIPGIVYSEKIEDVLFPESARRPYRDRNHIKANASASKIQAHILKATLQRQHITPQMCYMSKGEFTVIINQLVKANLIEIRVEDGVEYFDSTVISRQWEDNKIQELVTEIAHVAISSTTEGITTAYLNAAA